MEPSVGRIVTAVGAAALSNGAVDAPAVITRVFSQREDGSWCVNATVFPDATTLIRNVTSVALFDDAEVAMAACGNDSMTALHWPTRVGA
jgi:hypothetical protein